MQNYFEILLSGGLHAAFASFEKSQHYLNEVIACVMVSKILNGFETYTGKAVEGGLSVLCNQTGDQPNRYSSALAKLSG